MKLSWTPLASKLVGILIVLGLVTCVVYVDQSYWPAIAAIGTVGVVIWAIFSETILRRWRRPILKISTFGLEPTHLRQVPLRHVGGGLAHISGYPLSIQLVNTGETLAKSAQPLVTGMGRFEDGKWQIHDNWIPAPIRWALDISAEIGAGEPTQEKDLIPHRPYVFNFGILRTDHPNSFFLNPITMPGNQPVNYSPGEFCFELKVFAEGTEPARKYVHVQWEGGCSVNFNKVKKRITICLLDNPPWPKKEKKPKK